VTQPIGTVACAVSTVLTCTTPRRLGHIDRRDPRDGLLSRAVVDILRLLHPGHLPPPADRAGCAGVFRTLEILTGVLEATMQDP